MQSQTILTEIHREDTDVKRSILRAAALLAAFLLLICLLPRPVRADAAPQTAQPVSAQAAQEPSQLGSVIAIVCGAAVGFGLVMLRRKGAGKKSYMPDSKKKKK